MKKVLVAEDDLFIRDITTIKMVEHGYSVVSVENGEKVKEAIQSEPFDVILLDIDLGDISGYDILKWVRESEKYADQKVIVFSNRDDEDFKEKCTQLGIAGYFVKASTDFSEVFDCIDAL